MSSFHRRPGETKEGQVARDLGGFETTEFKDASLFDFDIDDDTPKPNHLEYLREVFRYMRRNRNLGSGRSFVVHLDGFASRTGDAKHNEHLSALREEAVKAQLVTALETLARNLAPNELPPIVSFNTKFHGFRDSPPGEDPHFRSVRIVVTRSPAPPPPVPVPQKGSTRFKIRLLFVASATSPVLFLPFQLDIAQFEIFDLKNIKTGRFSFVGGGFAVPVPKLPFVSGGAIGAFREFSITEPVDLRDFEGQAQFGQPPSAGPASLAPSMLTIQSPTFRLKEAFTRPDPLPIDSSFSVGVTIFSTTIGTLTLLDVRP